MTGQQAEAPRFPGGNPRTTKSELQPKPTRAEEEPAIQTGTHDPDALDCGCPVLSSLGLVPFQRFSKFSQAGADSRLHSPSRLIQLPGRLFVRQFREKRIFD